MGTFINSCVILVCCIFSVLNFIGLLYAGYLYFINKYAIVTLEDWNKVAVFYNEHFSEYDENGEPIPEEKSGGCGFFVGSLEEECYDEEGKDRKKKK